MTLFKKATNKWSSYPRVATPLSPRDFSYLNLYTLARCIPKATLIRNLVEEWISKSRPTLQETDLVQEIITHLNMRWKIERSQGKLSFDDYKDIVKKELTDRCIKDTHITVILSELRQ